MNLIERIIIIITYQPLNERQNGAQKFSVGVFGSISSKVIENHICSTVTFIIKASPETSIQAGQNNMFTQQFPFSHSIANPCPYRLDFLRLASYCMKNENCITNSSFRLKFSPEISPSPFGEMFFCCFSNETIGKTFAKVAKRSEGREFSDLVELLCNQQSVGLILTASTCSQ